MPSRLLFFPDEGHWVNDAKNSLIWHNEVLDWLTKWAIRGDGHKDAAPAAPDAPDRPDALVFQ